MILLYIHCHTQNDNQGPKGKLSIHVFLRLEIVNNKIQRDMFSKLDPLVLLEHISDD